MHELDDKLMVIESSPESEVASSAGAMKWYAWLTSDYAIWDFFVTHWGLSGILCLADYTSLPKCLILIQVW
jgi:hypothetical protein